jgi:tetratricopeptide (TPR) repeat protein
MIKNFRLLMVFILLFLQVLSKGQVLISNTGVNTDSLKNLVSGSNSLEQVDILNRITEIYAPVSFDSAIRYSAQAMRMATVNGDERGIGMARLYTGNAYYYKMDFKNALISYLSAWKILEENEAWKELGETAAMLGHINFFIIRHMEAASYYYQALNYNMMAGNEKSNNEVYYALSLTYWRDGNIDSASFYSDKLLNYAKKNNNLTIEVLALTLKGQMYEDEKAIPYYNEALEIAEKLNDNQATAILNNNLASFYDRSSSLFEIYGDLKISRFYYERALHEAFKVDYSIIQAMILLSLSEIDIEEGKYQQAEADLVRCKARLDAFYLFPGKTSSPHDFFPFGKIYDHYLMLRTKNELYNASYKLAFRRGDYDQAIGYLHRYYRSRDTLNSAQQVRQFELLLAEADAERNDQKFRTLAQQNELSRLRLSQSIFISAGIGAFVVIISLFLLLFFQRKRLTAEQKSILMEQRLLRAQMNPHFLFNSLASIQNYIINEDTDRASIYLSRFSQLVRNILDNSVEEYVPLEKEIETVTNYLELQKVRYAGKFDYNIDIDPDIETDIVQVPPMLAQPFIENSIEHGIRHRETPGRIDIRFRLEDSLIRFEVEDDGVGREKAKEIEARFGTKHRSMATSITRDRLMSINRKLERKIRMEIVDLKDEDGEGIGTRVTFGIPVVVR